MVFRHRTVLLEPAVDAMLNPAFGARARRRANAPESCPRLNGVYVDGTFGRGGHARLLLERLGPQARLLVFDKDPEAVAVAQQMQQQDSRLLPVHDGFARLPQVLDALGLDCVDGILLDLGISSPQIDDAQRGFSFMRDGPLDMRMDTGSGPTAAEWLERANEDEIREVIAHYGEERFAFQIAKAIVARRRSDPLRTTGELAELVAAVVRTREKGQHPATRTFQAIRIHINGELQELALALAAALMRLRPGGRLVIISFHSLEDRMVKQCMAAAARPERSWAHLPIPEKDMPRPWLLLLGRVRADATEIAENTRARSAIMRVAERTAEPLDEKQAAALAPLPQATGKSAARRRGRRKMSFLAQGGVCRRRHA